MKFKIPKHFVKYFFTEPEQTAILLMIDNYEVNGYTCYYLCSKVNLIEIPTIIKKWIKRVEGCKSQGQYKLFLYEDAVQILDKNAI